MKNFFSIIFLFLIIHQSYSQTDFDIEQTKKKYPNDNAITVLKKTNIEFYKKKGTLFIVTDSYDETILLSQKNAKAYASNSVYYSDFSKINDLEAYTLIPDKKGYKRMDVTNYSISKDIDNGVFFDNSTTKEFDFPAVSSGCRTILHINKTLNESHLWGSFYFSSYITSLNCELTITVPEYVKIKYKVLNDNQKKIAFSSQKKGSNTIYCWKVNNMGKYKSQDYSPDVTYYLPHILLSVESYTDKNHEILINKDQQSLYNWYMSLLKPINKNDETELKNFTDSLIKNKSSEFEKVKSVYYWVQQNVKYIAFEDGFNGFVPRDAALVFKKRYGDCKDMANLIQRMLKSANIYSSLTWVGTRDIAYIVSEFPSTYNDNHMITSYYSADSNKYYFLDATSLYTSILVPSSSVQGKEALLSINDTTFKIVTIPIPPASKNQYIDTLELWINNGVVKGVGQTIIKGYPANIITQIYDNKPYDKIKESLSSLLSKGNNKFSVDSFKYVKQGKYDDEMIFKYWFSNPDYITSSSNQIFVNLNFDKSSKDSYIDTNERTAGIYRNYKTEEKYVYILNIPKDFVLEEFPTNTFFKSDKFNYSINYNMRGNKIILSKTILNDFIYLPLNEIVEYNKMVKQINSDYNKSISFNKKAIPKQQTNHK